MNLERLVIPDAFARFSNADPHLRILCSRLKYLKIKRRTVDDLPLLGRIKEVLSLPGAPVSITHFSVWLNPSKNTNAFLELMEHFAKLQRLSADVSPIDVELIERLCEICPGLHHIRRPYPFFEVRSDIQIFMREGAAARLAKTRVGFNFTPRDQPGTFVNNLFLLTIPDPVEYLDWLQSIALSGPIQPGDLFGMLSRVSHLENLEPAKRLWTLLTSNTSRFLPPFQTIQELGLLRRFWSNLVTASDVSHFNVLVGCLGSPDVSCREQMLIRLLNRKTADIFDEFIAAFRKTCDFDACKFVADNLNNAILLRTLFSSVQSKQGLRWLLENVPVDLARNCISSDGDAEERSIFLDYLSRDVELAKFVMEHFKDTSFMNLPQTDDFVTAAIGCMKGFHFNLFQRLVDTTGMHNVTAEARGCVLWGALQCSESIGLFTGDFFLRAWENNLSLNREPQPALLHASRGTISASFIEFMTIYRPNCRPPGPIVVEFIEKYLPLLVEQVGALRACSILELIEAIVHLALLLPQSGSLVVDRLFVAFAKAYVRKVSERRAVSLSLILLERCLRNHGSYATAQCMISIHLLHRCAEADFMVENSCHHRIYRSWIAKMIRSHITSFISFDQKSELFLAALSCLEDIDLNCIPENESFNLMDMILFKENVLLMGNQSFSILELLARKGGRISHSGSAAGRYDRQASATFLEALAHKCESD